MNNDFNWTPEAVEELKRLWGDKVSCSKIALELHAQFGGNPTRNAVIGKIHRLGLYEPSRRQSPKLGRPRKPYRPRTHMFNPPTEPVETLEASRSLSPDEIPIEQRKQLLDLQPDDCRWPYGDPGKPDFFFCGATSESGRPYCSYHDHVARYGSENISEEEQARRKVWGHKMLVIRRQQQGRASS